MADFFSRCVKNKNRDYKSNNGRDMSKNVQKFTTFHNVFASEIVNCERIFLKITSDGALASAMVWSSLKEIG